MGLLGLPLLKVNLFSTQSFVEVTFFLQIFVGIIHFSILVFVLITLYFTELVNLLFPYSPDQLIW